MSNDFGGFLRERREKLRRDDRKYSIRQVAGRIGIEPAYLSKIERAEQPPPSEATIRKLAADLGCDADVLLALGGKVSADLQKIIRRRPELFARLIRELENMPDHAIVNLVREVRDGTW
jgi:transcriptional regulator with XRE-family HTH domain